MEKKNRDSSATSFPVAVNKWRTDGKAGDGGDGDDGVGDGVTAWFGHRGKPAAVTRRRMVPQPGRRTEVTRKRCDGDSQPMRCACAR